MNTERQIAENMARQDRAIVRLVAVTAFLCGIFAAAEAAWWVSVPLILVAVVAGLFALSITLLIEEGPEE